jgi:hypothetical protein
MKKILSFNPCYLGLRNCLYFILNNFHHLFPFVASPLDPANKLLLFFTLKFISCFCFFSSLYSSSNGRLRNKINYKLCVLLEYLSQQKDLYLEGLQYVNSSIVTHHSIREIHRRLSHLLTHSFCLVAKRIKTTHCYCLMMRKLLKCKYIHHT